MSKHPWVDESQMAQEARECGAVIRAQLAQQAQVDALAEHLRAYEPHAVMTVARGSSDHAANYWSYLLMRRLGVLTCSLPPSLVTLHKAPLRVQRMVALGLSQSGASPDLVETLSYARRAGAYAVAGVNQVDSPLAHVADVALPVLAGVERSVAATKSCLGMMSLAAQVVATWANDGATLRGLQGLSLAFDAQSALAGESDEGVQAIEVLRQLDRVLVIGRGLSQSVALEAALKMKETCAIQSEAFSVAEVRHGPMRLIEQGFGLVVFITPGEEQPQLIDFCVEMRGRGANVLAIVVMPPQACDRLREAGVWVLPCVFDEVGCDAETAEILAPLAVLQRFYLFVSHLSQARGLNPDKPLFLNKVTQTV